MAEKKTLTTKLNSLMNQQVPPSKHLPTCVACASCQSQPCHLRGNIRQSPQQLMIPMGCLTLWESRSCEASLNFGSSPGFERIQGDGSSWMTVPGTHGNTRNNQWDPSGKFPLAAYTFLCQPFWKRSEKSLQI